MSIARPNLLGASPEQLHTLTGGLLGAPFRSRQLHDALHRQTVASFAAITNLSKEQRRALTESFSIERPPLQRTIDASDGTKKFLFELNDGATIEAVIIPDGDRRTFCVSSQAGCALACRFCVTGFWGAGRNLAASEIVGQIFALRETQQIDWARVNLVFMGMGEPLLNLGAVQQALEAVSGLVPWTRTTVSTAGIVPGIRAMATWSERPNLAISLHAPNDPIRTEIMPINRKYPLVDLFAALREYPVTRTRRLTFEYILIDRLNDAAHTARELVTCLHGFRCRVNLIPFNPDPVLGDLRPPNAATVDRFREILVEGGLRAVVRRPRGLDVAAACGQLRAFGRQPRGFPIVRGDQEPVRQMKA